MQKYANLLELEKCCQTHIFLQNFVLIQPRTSPLKICKILQNFAKFANFADLIWISWRDPTMRPTTRRSNASVRRYQRARGQALSKSTVHLGSRVDSLVSARSSPMQLLFGAVCFRETFGSSLSAVSTPLISRARTVFSILRDLQDFTDSAMF